MYIKLASDRLKNRARTITQQQQLTRKYNHNMNSARPQILITNLYTGGVGGKDYQAFVQMALAYNHLLTIYYKQNLNQTKHGSPFT